MEEEKGNSLRQKKTEKSRQSHVESKRRIAERIEPVLFTHAGTWRRDARHLRASFARFVSFVLLVSPLPRLSLPPFFSLFLSISLTRRPSPRVSSASLSRQRRVSIPSAFLHPPKAHCSTKRAPSSPPACTPYTVVLCARRRPVSLYPTESVFQQRALRPLAAFCSFPFRHCVSTTRKKRDEERKRDDDRKKEVSVGRRDVGKRFSNALALYISVVRPFFHGVSPSFRGFPRFSVLLVSRDIFCRRLAPRTDRGQ